MSIKIDVWTAFLAYEKLVEAIENIDPATGYNLRPTILTEALTPETMSSTDYPAVHIELLGLRSEDTKLGGPQSYTEDAALLAIIWGYVEEPGDMNKALLAMTIDILEAIWADETLDDNSILTNLETVEFDDSLSKADNVGVVAVGISIPFQTARGLG